MTTVPIRTLLTVTIIVGATTPAIAQEPQSHELAKALTAAMTQHQMDAIAARDPVNPDRFIAALYIPHSELLVVAAQFADPSAFDRLLTSRQYRDLYVDLQASPVRQRPLFVQDMGADGLCAESSQLPDTVQESGNAQTVFDGEWSKHKMPRNEFEQKYHSADAEYSQLLRVLLTAAQTAP